MEDPGFDPHVVIGRETVVVPLGWFREVLEVYFAAKAQRLVPATLLDGERAARARAESALEPPPVRDPLTAILGTEVVTLPPPGYTPRGVADPNRNAPWRRAGERNGGG